MNIVKLHNNYGYSWYTHNNINAKGYLFDKDGKLWMNDDLPCYFDDCKSADIFCNKLKESHGIFSVIIKENDFLMAAVDKIRMFPLFYTTKGAGINITDNPNYFDTKDYSLNPLSVSEFLATGYVTDKNTLLNDLYQVEAGQGIIYTGNKVETFWYHQMLSDNNYPLNEQDDPENSLIEIIERMFERTGRLAKDKKIAIPLSGGFDSRLIALMLKKQGFNDVTCFTYGRKNNREAIISKKVANILGFKWLFIEYNDELCKGYINDKNFLDYALFTSNFCSMPYLQDYFAVKYLKENKLVDNDTIMMLGHSLGAIVGARQSPKNKYIYNNKKTAQIIFKNNYTLIRSKTSIKKELKSKVISQTDHLRSSCLISGDIYQNWELKEKLAKFISNSTNVFNWFGYKQCLPFLNVDFLEFYANLNFKHKIYKKLYKEVLANKYFKPNGILFKHELQATPADYKMHALKSKFKFLVPSHIIKRKMLKGDWSYYGVLTAEMKKQLKDKGIKPTKCRNSFNEMIVQWYIEFIKNKSK